MVNKNNMDISIPSNKNKWVENFARWGYAAKGIVYCLLGILALIAAFGSGSSKNTEKQDVFNLILEQPFGKFLLGAVALGLLGYVMWRLIEVFKDPHNHGKKIKGIIVRIGYLISALVYFSFSVIAIKLILGNGAGSNSGNTQQTLLSKVMSYEAGVWAVGIVAIIFMIRGIQQIAKAFTGKFRKDIQEGKIDRKYRTLLVRAGSAGYFSRGIVWGIVGFLFLKAAIHSNPSEVGDTSNALGLLENFGSWVLGTVAAGLICYGVFKILEALYKRFNF